MTLCLCLQTVGSWGIAEVEISFASWIGRSLMFGAAARLYRVLEKSFASSSRAGKSKSSAVRANSVSPSSLGDAIAAV